MRIPTKVSAEFLGMSLGLSLKFKLRLELRPKNSKLIKS